MKTNDDKPGTGAELSRIAHDMIDRARDGTLSSVPREYLTKEILCEPLNMGLHYGHSGPDDFMEFDMLIQIAALHGNLGQIPQAILGECACVRIARVSSEDNDPETILHIAAKTGQLNRFSKGVLTVENLFEMFDTRGRSVTMVAAEAGSFEQIPPALVTRTNLTAQNRNGETVYHYLARGGQISKLPSHLRQWEFFQLNDINGSTPLHWAWAPNGNPNGIPDDFDEAYNEDGSRSSACARLLQIQDRSGKSVLDYAIERPDKLNQISSEDLVLCGQFKLKNGKYLREVLKELKMWPEDEAAD